MNANPNFDFTESIIAAAAKASGTVHPAVITPTSPEEAYKRFVLGVSEGISDIIAQRLAEAVAKVTSNPSINTMVNGVDWIREYIVGKPIGIEFHWATPGYQVPASLQNHMSFGHVVSKGDGDVSANGVDIGIGISKAADENPSGPAPTVMMASLMNWGHLS